MSCEGTHGHGLDLDQLQKNKKELAQSIGTKNKSRQVAQAIDMGPGMMRICHIEDLASHAVLYLTGYDFSNENRTCKLLIISFRCAWFVLATEATRRYYTPLHTVSYMVLVKQQGVVSIQGGYHICYIKTIKTYSQNHDLLAN